MEFRRRIPTGGTGSGAADSPERTTKTDVVAEEIPLTPPTEKQKSEALVSWGWTPDEISSMDADVFEDEDANEVVRVRPPRP